MRRYTEVNREELYVSVLDHCKDNQLIAARDLLQTVPVIVAAERAITFQARAAIKRGRSSTPR